MLVNSKADKSYVNAPSSMKYSTWFKLTVSAGTKVKVISLVRLVYKLWVETSVTVPEEISSDAVTILPSTLTPATSSLTDNVPCPLIVSLLPLTNVV